MKRSLITLLAVLAGLLAAVAAASAGGGGWARVSEPGAAGSVGLARAGDGTLHVVWAKGGAAYDTRVSPGGGVRGRTSVVTGWASVSGPALVVLPDGSLRAFVSGSVNSGDIGDAIGIHTLTAPATGGRWTLDQDAVWGGALANQRDVRATLGKDGQPATAVGGSGAVFFRGIGRGQQATVLPPTPYSYDPEVAVDGGSGAIVASWFVDQDGRRGIVTQQIFPSVGQQRFVGEADDAVDGGVSGRLGAAGTYVVVSSPVGVRFGKVGGSFRLVGKDTGVKAVDVTAGPEGRLWVAWLSGDGKLHALRSNRAASTFGSVQVVAAPGGSPTAFELASEGSAGPLDAVARYATGSEPAWWHHRVLPPLRATAARTKRGVLTVRVSDVGDPVAGAKVIVGGRSATTDARGRATLTGVAAGGEATVTAPGYQPTSARFT